MRDPLDDALERIQSAKLCRDAGDPNWAFGLSLAICALARCVRDHWQWKESEKEDFKLSRNP